MKKRNAAMTAVALFFAGATVYANNTVDALWTDRDAADTVNMRSGDLDIAAIGSPAWRNISNEGADTILPEETVEVRQPLDVAVRGNNLKVNMQASLRDVPPTSVASQRWRLLDKSGNDLSGWLSGPNVYNLPLSSQGSVPKTLDNIEDFTVVAQVTYAKHVSSRYVFGSPFKVSVTQEIK